jgi:hypothetical protein
MGKKLEKRHSPLIKWLLFPLIVTVFGGLIVDALRNDAESQRIHVPQDSSVEHVNSKDSQPTESSNTIIGEWTWMEGQGKFCGRLLFFEYGSMKHSCQFKETWFDITGDGRSAIVTSKIKQANGTSRYRAKVLKLDESLVLEWEGANSQEKWVEQYYRSDPKKRFNWWVAVGSFIGIVSTLCFVCFEPFRIGVAWLVGGVVALALGLFALGLIITFYKPILIIAMICLLASGNK